MPSPRFKADISTEYSNELETYYINDLAGNSLMHEYIQRNTKSWCISVQQTIAASALRFNEVAVPQINPYKKPKPAASDKSPPPPSHFNGKLMDGQKWEPSIVGIN